MSSPPAKGAAFGPPEELQRALGATGERHIDPTAGTARLHYLVRPEFCHTGGIAQGGFVTGWLDAAMAFAMMARATEPIWLATLELKVSFLAAARDGMEVVATGRIVRAGSSIAFLEAELHDLDGALIATSSSTAKLIKLQRS